MSDMPSVTNDKFFLVAQIKFPKYIDDIKRIFSRNTLKIRSSFPNPRNHPHSYYIWRNVVFNVSPKPSHQCMPVTSCFYFKKSDYENYEGEYDYQKRLSLTKELDEVVNFIVNNIPKEHWYGVRRWVQVF